MKKVAFLIGPNLRHKAFVEMAINSNQEVLIIIDTKNRNRRIFKRVSLLKKIKFHFFRYIFGDQENKLKRVKSIVESAYFKEYAGPWPANLKSSIIELNINSQDSKNLLQKFQPEIIVSFGTRLISKSIYVLAKRAAINIHTGISPNYRGGHSNFWAYLRADYRNVGATIHLLDESIDNGKILNRVYVREKSNYFTANCEAIELSAKYVSNLEVFSFDTGDVNSDTKGLYKSNFDFDAYQIWRFFRKFFNGI